MNRHEGCPAGQICEVLRDLEVDKDLMAAALSSSSEAGVPLCHELVSVGAVSVEEVMQLLSVQCSSSHGSKVAEAGVMASLAGSMARSVVKRCERITAALPAPLIAGD